MPFNPTRQDIVRLIKQYIEPIFIAQAEQIQHNHQEILQVLLQQNRGESGPGEREIAVAQEMYQDYEMKFDKLDMPLNDKSTKRLSISKFRADSNGQYTCDQYDASFTHPNNRKRHQISHKIANYQCELCDKVYNRKDNLVRHKRDKHAQ